MMLANSINLEKDQAKINPKDYSAEYKWEVKQCKFHLKMVRISFFHTFWR